MEKACETVFRRRQDEACRTRGREESRKSVDGAKLFHEARREKGSALAHAL